MNLSIRNYPSFRNRHHHRHHQFHACSGCPRHSDTHSHIGKDRCRISYYFCKNSSIFAARQLVRSAFVLSWERNLFIGMFYVCVISDLILYWCSSLSSFIPGSTLQGIISVLCVKHKDDFIIISCEGHQPVVEAFTCIFDYHYGCWFLDHLLQKNHSIYQGQGYFATCSLLIK